jgi:hypothetical protein
MKVFFLVGMLASSGGVRMDCMVIEKLANGRYLLDSGSMQSLCCVACEGSPYPNRLAACSYAPWIVHAAQPGDAWPCRCVQVDAWKEKGDMCA